MGNNVKNKQCRDHALQYIQMKVHKNTAHSHHCMAKNLLNFDYL